METAVCGTAVLVFGVVGGTAVTLPERFVMNGDGRLRNGRFAF